MKKGALVLDDERLLRAAASKSLREFVRQAFNIVVLAEPFMASWHTDSICDHLEALRRREIRNLLITMPPRHLKSTIVSVLFPPWCWLHDPTERFLTASYAADLATRDAVASRTLIESPWFQRWPVRIDQTQNRQDRFSNTRRGYRLVTSVGGSTTGEVATFSCWTIHTIFGKPSRRRREPRQSYGTTASGQREATIQQPSAASSCVSARITRMWPAISSRRADTST
jgi:hypothetical protein